MGLALGDIDKLFRDHGHIEYSGEGVTQLAHALQAAQLAEGEKAGDLLVTAALLHDLGHVLNVQGETQRRAASTTSTSTTRSPSCARSSRPP